MHLLMLIPFLAFTTTASMPKHLSRRCSPAYDPELARGYYPPAPCWQDFDTSCQPYLLEGTDMMLDAQHSLAVIYGVSSSCVAEIAEELARTKDGRKNYGWVKKYGKLNSIGDGILVISEMPDTAVKAFQRLKYKKDSPSN
jgi:hypothetical protein